LILGPVRTYDKCGKGGSLLQLWLGGKLSRPEIDIIAKLENYKSKANGSPLLEAWHHVNGGILKKY
jgi:hypothetical protein